MADLSSRGPGRGMGDCTEGAWPLPPPVGAGISSIGSARGLAGCTRPGTLKVLPPVALPKLACIVCFRLREMSLREMHRFYTKQCLRTYLSCPVGSRRAL